MDNKLVFSTPRFVVMFIDNLERIGMISTISIFSIYMIIGKYISFYGILLILISCVAIPYLSNIIISRFKIAHRIEIDFTKNEIIFFVHKACNAFIFKFDKIKKIKIKGYIIFEINGEKLYCNKADDKNLLIALEKVAKLSNLVVQR